MKLAIATVIATFCSSNLLSTDEHGTCCLVTYHTSWNASAARRSNPDEREPNAMLSGTSAHAEDTPGRGVVMSLRACPREDAGE
jgi:hypothetical protein